MVSFAVTALQLGLDQMSDASSTSISSFIAWFVCIMYVSTWIPMLLTCINSVFISKNAWLIQLCSLVSPICLAVVLVLDFVSAEKWLLIEPKSPQSFKTMYQVLKFAWKYKSPLNRSALTYWEEDIPSRMDLGKSRFGGPTEQVEDVKTILRLILLCLPLWFIESMFSVLFGSTFQFIEVSGWTRFEKTLLQLLIHLAIILIGVG